MIRPWILNSKEAWNKADFGVLIRRREDNDSGNCLYSTALYLKRVGEDFEFVATVVRNSLPISRWAAVVFNFKAERVLNATAFFSHRERQLAIRGQSYQQAA